MRVGCDDANLRKDMLGRRLMRAGDMCVSNLFNFLSVCLKSGHFMVGNRSADRPPKKAVFMGVQKNKMLLYVLIFLK